MIVSVELLSREEIPTAIARAIRWSIEFRWGLFTIKATYRARIDVPVRGDVNTEADQSPGVRLRGTVSFEPIEGGTRIPNGYGLPRPGRWPRSPSGKPSKPTPRCSTASGGSLNHVDAKGFSTPW